MDNRTDLLAHVLSVIEEEGVKVENAALVRLRRENRNMRLACRFLMALCWLEVVVILWMMR